MARVTATHVLVRARELLARRGGWTKGEAARDADGRYVEIRGRDAVRFCAWGAVRRAAWLLARDEDEAAVLTKRARDRLAARLGVGYLVALNDAPSTRKRDVLALFDAAIEAKR